MGFVRQYKRDNHVAVIVLNQKRGEERPFPSFFFYEENPLLYFAGRRCFLRVDSADRLQARGTAQGYLAFNDGMFRVPRDPDSVYPDKCDRQGGADIGPDELFLEWDPARLI